MLRARSSRASWSSPGAMREPPRMSRRSVARRGSPRESMTCRNRVTLSTMKPMSPMIARTSARATRHSGPCSRITGRDGLTEGIVGPSIPLPLSKASHRKPQGGAHPGHRPCRVRRALWRGVRAGLGLRRHHHAEQRRRKCQERALIARNLRAEAGVRNPCQRLLNVGNCESLPRRRPSTADSAMHGPLSSTRPCLRDRRLPGGRLVPGMVPTTNVRPTMANVSCRARSPGTHSPGRSIVRSLRWMAVVRSGRSCTGASPKGSLSIGSLPASITSVTGHGVALRGRGGTSVRTPGVASRGATERMGRDGTTPLQWSTDGCELDYMR